VWKIHTRCGKMFGVSSMVCVFSRETSRTRVVVGESEKTDSGSLLHDGWQELCRLSSFVLERETVQKSEAERASLVVLLKLCSPFPLLLLEDHENLGLSAVPKENWC
jgi:hypothetical protein